MICNNCHKLLNQKSAPFGYCCCKNNHFQCIKCDREKHKCCATCNSPTEIELPDFKMLAKKMQKTSEAKALSDIPKSSKQNDEVPNVSMDDTFYTQIKIDNLPTFSPSTSNDLFDPELVITSIFDNKIEEHTENNLNTKTSVCSPTGSGSSLLSLKLFNLFEGDDKPDETPYAGSIYSSMSTSPQTIQSLQSQNQSDSSEESDHTLTKNDNDDVVSVQNCRPMSPWSSPNSGNPSSPQMNRFSPIESEPEKEDENKSACSSIDISLQKFLENFHEGPSKPDWSKMDSRMPEIVKSLQRSGCEPEELPWRLLQKVSKVLKHDSEEAEKRNNGKE